MKDCGDVNLGDEEFASAEGELFSLSKGRMLLNVDVEWIGRGDMKGKRRLERRDMKEYGQVTVMTVLYKSRT